MLLLMAVASLATAGQHSAGPVKVDLEKVVAALNELQAKPRAKRRRARPRRRDGDGQEPPAG